MGESPFESISSRYLRRFGERVQKIPVTIAGTCPNRLGLKGMRTCVFCDEWGSAAYPEQQGQNLHEQIRSKLGRIGGRYGVRAFLVYFQAYTSSFLAVRRLREHFETALSFPQVRGLVLGTRPDCVPPALLDLFAEYEKQTFVSLELGVQSFDDAQLAWMRRGHGAQATIDCIRRVRERGEWDLGIHLIFGLPGETEDSVVATAKQVAQLPVDHVKLHNLHVLKGTPLEEMYREGKFAPLDLETYAHRVGLFLSYLPRRIAVQRLAALATRWEELVAPEWTRHKMRSHQYILDHLARTGIRQGQGCHSDQFV